MFYIDEIRKCEDQGSKAIVWDLKLKRLSRKQLVLRGNISMTVPLDDKVAGDVVVAERSNGAWVEKGLVFKLPNFCQDIMGIVKSGWTDFWENAGVPPPIKCPIPKGNYFLNDFPTSKLAKSSLPAIKHGTFKATMAFINKQNARLGCFGLVVHTAQNNG